MREKSQYFPCLSAATRKSIFSKNTDAGLAWGLALCCVYVFCAGTSLTVENAVLLLVLMVLCVFSPMLRAGFLHSIIRARCWRRLFLVASSTTVQYVVFFTHCIFSSRELAPEAQRSEAATRKSTCLVSEGVALVSRKAACVPRGDFRSGVLVSTTKAEELRSYEIILTHSTLSNIQK